MAENRGGYRKPNNPAAVSGPGKYSRRTDGGPMDKQPQRYMAGESYGESKELNELQASAPMAASPAKVSETQAQPRRQAPMPTPFGAETQRPDEPVTSGAPIGAGTNRLDFMNKKTPEDNQKIAILLSLAERAAAEPDASYAITNLVRKLRGLI